MVGEFKKLSTDQSWSYRWSFGQNPVVSFTNPRVKTVVNFSLLQLNSILEEDECDFIPVPRNVMQSAREAVNVDLNCAA